MVNKNIQIKHYDGTERIDLFPKTVGDIVNLNDGTTLETKIASIISTLSNKVTIQEVDAEIEKIVGAAPEALDTLNELATALGDDPNFAASITAEIGSKVDKVSGKSLTTNDFTNALKTKLDSLSDHSTDIADLQTDKADRTEIYTKKEVDARINNLQANAIPVSATETAGASIWFEDLT
ncbi:MAG: hypothetical protein L0J63_08050 [Tetragenococcus koreensis]|nr:hypothetical protein [Tetragenococcus koreensis]